MPLVFEETVVWFTAGPTTYEFQISLDHAPFSAVGMTPDFADGQATVGPLNLTPDQKLLVVALAENILRRGNRGGASVPSSAVAAERLGWTLTKFNRKLDNVCEKVGRIGVRGLHGDADRLASDRRTRLVEYALAARLVGPPDLLLLGSQP